MKAARVIGVTTSSRRARLSDATRDGAPTRVSLRSRFTEPTSTVTSARLARHSKPETPMGYDRKPHRPRRHAVHSLVSYLIPRDKGEP